MLGKSSGAAARQGSEFREIKDIASIGWSRSLRGPSVAFGITTYFRYCQVGESKIVKDSCSLRMTW